MSEMIRYEAARQALAEAKAIDEVKDWHDKAAAMEAYARQANNHDMEADAAEIRMRATRRLDELRQAQKATVGLNEGGRPQTGLKNNPVKKPTLDSQGIDKNLADHGRKLGAMSEDEFEREVDRVRSRKKDKGKGREQPAKKKTPEQPTKTAIAAAASQKVPGTIGPLPTDDEEPEGLTEEELAKLGIKVKPEDYLVPFLTRADQAARFAFYTGSIVNSNVVEAADHAAERWTKLATELRTRQTERKEKPPAADLPTGDQTKR
jgi:hypothetical protein